MSEASVLRRKPKCSSTRGQRDRSRVQAALSRMAAHSGKLLVEHLDVHSRELAE